VAFELFFSMDRQRNGVRKRIKLQDAKQARSLEP
jgi:hypothetical protein